MGMFDNITISTSQLPLTDTEKATIGKRFYAQTKCLECVLNSYLITKKGDLVLRTTATKYQKLDFTGTIEFYDSINGTWYEFIATFTNGKLVGIERVYS